LLSLGQSNQHYRLETACLPVNTMSDTAPVGDLILLPTYGFANRVRAMLTGLEVARLTGRPLRMHWRAQRGVLMGGAADFFDAAYLLQHFPPVAPAVVDRLGLDTRPFAAFPITRNVADLARLLQVAPHATVVLHTCHMLVPPGAAPGAAERMTADLRGLRLADDLEADATTVVAAARTAAGATSAVGLHVRTWSGRIENAVAARFQHNNAEWFLREMRQAVDTERARPGGRAVVFLAAVDDEAMRMWLDIRAGAADVAHCTLVPIRSPAQPDAGAPTGRNSVAHQRAAVLQWNVLSRTDGVIGSTGSSFSDLAARRTASGRLVLVGDALTFRRSTRLMAAALSTVVVLLSALQPAGQRAVRLWQERGLN
jgi:hypothetical protein